MRVIPKLKLSGGGTRLHELIEQRRSGWLTRSGAGFRKLVFPKSATLMYLFWAFVFILISLLIHFQRDEVTRNGNIIANFARTQINWVLEPYVEPRRGADHARSELLGLGNQFFHKDRLNEAFVTLVNELADDIRNGNFNDQRGAGFVKAIREMYTSYQEQHNEILRKSGFYYFYLLIIIVIAYQLFVNAIYLVLDSTPASDRDRDTSTFLTEGAFNAIDLTILAAITYMYFDAEWLTLSAVVFFSYLGHMVIFGIFLDKIKDRRTKAALSAYFLSVLMTLTMAGIENMTYLATGIFFISVCVLLAFFVVRVIMPRIGGIGRLAPYIPGPSSIHQPTQP
jgi:hypothetical protein